MTIEQTLTSINDHLATIVSLLQNQQPVHARTEPAATTEPETAPAVPTIDELVKVAVEFADKNGQDKLLELIHKFNPDAGKLSEVPEKHRADLFNALAVPDYLHRQAG